MTKMMRREVQRFLCAFVCRVLRGAARQILQWITAIIRRAGRNCRGKSAPTQNAPESKMVRLSPKIHIQVDPVATSTSQAIPT